VWLEVQLQRAVSLAARRQCSEAVSMADHLGDSVPDLAFTHDGLVPLLASARFNYLRGTLYQACKLPEKAQASFKNAAGQTALEDGIWAWKAAQQFPGFPADLAQQKLESDLQRTLAAGETSSRTGWWLYNAAMLDRALGHADKAAAEFRQVLLYPDQMLTYHLTRLALSESGP